MMDNYEITAVVYGLEEEDFLALYHLIEKNILDFTSNYSLANNLDDSEMPSDESSPTLGG